MGLEWVFLVDLGSLWRLRCWLGESTQFWGHPILDTAHEDRLRCPFGVPLN